MTNSDGFIFCIRVDAKISQEGIGGQECCYDSNGLLLSGPSIGGSLEQWSPRVSWSNHHVYDIIPQIHCCYMNEDTCSLYYDLRPSDDCSAFTQPSLPGRS